MPHQPVLIIARVKQKYKGGQELLESTSPRKDLDNRKVGPPNLSFLV
jgi:hypothetical protein